MDVVLTGVVYKHRDVVYILRTILLLELDAVVTRARDVPRVTYAYNSVEVQIKGHLVGQNTLLAILHWPRTDCQHNLGDKHMKRW